jgi:hypothetical protein
MPSVSGMTSTLASAATAPFTAARRAADPFSKTLGSAMSSDSNATNQAQPAGYDPSSPAAVRVTDLRNSADLSLSEFKRTLKQLFTDAGINTSQMIRLEPDGNGGVTVVGQHPDRDKIEKIFEENPDLAAKFRALAQKFNDLHAAENKRQSDQPLLGPSFGLSIINDDFQVAFK